MSLSLEMMFGKYGKVYNPDDIIFCEYESGNDFYLIQEGRVKVVKTVGNSIKTLDILEQGDIFGEMAILEEQPRSATAIALTEVKLLNFNRANFEILMTKNPQWALKVLTVFTTRIYDAKRRLMALMLDDIQGKVADVLLMLAEKQMHNHNTVKEVILNITQEDVANWCAQPLSDVQKVLQTMVKSGRLEIYNDRIVILNVVDLQRIVQSKRK